MAKLRPPGETPISLRLDAPLLASVDAWVSEQNCRRAEPITRTDLLRGIITWAVKNRPAWEPDPSVELQEKWDQCVRGDWMAKALVPMAERHTAPRGGAIRPFLADMMLHVIADMAHPPSDAMVVLERLRLCPMMQTSTRDERKARLAAMLAACPYPSKTDMAEHRRPEVQAQIARHFALSAANCGPADVDKCFLMAIAAHATRKVQDDYSDDEYHTHFKLGAVAAATIVKQYVPLAPASFEKVWKSHAQNAVSLSAELRGLTPGA